VACFDPASSAGVFAFVVDSRGDWAIEANSNGPYLRDVATGLTSARSPVVSGSCSAGPGAASRLILRIGAVQVASVTATEAHPAHWNGGVCVITTAGWAVAVFTFSDFSITRLA
jgi:hypothetical protein